MNEELMTQRCRTCKHLEIDRGSAHCRHIVHFNCEDSTYPCRILVRPDDFACLLWHTGSEAVLTPYGEVMEELQGVKDQLLRVETLITERMR